MNRSLFTLRIQNEYKMLSYRLLDRVERVSHRWAYKGEGVELLQ
jgi:hypothetical protein